MARSPRSSGPSDKHRFRPEVLPLENRTTPTVSILNNVPGAAYNTTLNPSGVDSNFRIPADPSIAAGPNRMVEIVDASLFIMDKQGAVINQTNLFDYFTPLLPPQAPIFNTTVVYDDTAGRFYFFFLENVAGSGRLFYAVSDTSTPNTLIGNFTVHGSLTTTFVSPTNGPTEPVALKVGFNREAVVVTMNMISAAGKYDSTFVVAIDKRSMLTGVNTPLTTFGTHLDNLNYGMAPAIMHNAPAGSPMYFVSTFGVGSMGTPFSNSVLRVTTMTNILSLRPVFQFQSMTVANYGNGPVPNAAQPFDVLNLGDTQITNLAWRNGEFVAAQTAKINGKGEATWYDFNLVAGKPTLIQEGSIDAGKGVSTFFPRIDISLRGDIGLSYNQSSATEPMSFYVTGRVKADGAGGMQPAVRVAAGNATYRDQAGAPYLPGSYTGLVLDAQNQNTFWAVGVWATSTQPINNWATQLASFAITQRVAVAINVYGGVRWTFSAATGQLSTTMTFINNSPGTISGTFILVFQITDPAAIILSPGGARVGNQLLVPITGTFAKGQIIRFPFIVQTPNKTGVPTFYLSAYQDLL
jgi:hypothetical protein